MRKRNQTSFMPGHKRSPESIEKQRATLKAKYASGELVSPGLGMVWTDEQLQRRAATRRKNAIGNRMRVSRDKREYWMVMTETGHRYEHRVVMEEVLGRPLLTTELVHHIDHNGLNNDPSNLEILDVAEHNKKEFTGRQSPMKGKKMFDGWSRKYANCQKCGRTSVAHRARGLCGTCYNKRDLYGIAAD